MLISLARQQAAGLDKSISALSKVSIIRISIYIALKQFGKEWKNVEDFIGTRTGA
mgnify:CR=1 FL=1